MAYEAAPSALTLPELQGLVLRQSFGLSVVVLAGYAAQHGNGASLNAYKTTKGVVSSLLLAPPSHTQPDKPHLALSARSHHPEQSGWALPTGEELAEFAAAHQRTPGVVGAMAMKLQSDENVDFLLYRAGLEDLVPGFGELVTTDPRPDILEMRAHGLHAAFLMYGPSGVLSEAQAGNVAALYA